MFGLILLVLAFVLALLAAFVAPVEPWRWRLLCLAVAAFFLAELLKGVPTLR